MSPIILEGGGNSPGPTGLCGTWATSFDVCAPCNDYALDASLLDDKLLMASETLYFASGQQFRGLCEETIAPCSMSFFAPYNLGLTNNNGILTLQRSDFFYMGACGCHSIASCSCSSLPAIQLPRDVIQEVTEVITTDDGILDPSAYELRSGNELVRLDGLQFPCCDDAFRVSYTYGRQPPLLGINAAAALGCEFYIACDIDAFEGLCRLPRGVTSIIRQGTSVQIRALADLFTPRPGRPIQFGIPEVDMFLSVFNPNGMIAPTAFVSPDDPPLGRLV